LQQAIDGVHTLPHVPQSMAQKAIFCFFNHPECGCGNILVSSVGVSVCVSCLVCAVTFESCDLETLYLIRRYIIGISRSGSYVKVCKDVLVRMHLLLPIFLAEVKMLP